MAQLEAGLDQRWRQKALCRGMSVDLFVIKPPRSLKPEHLERIKKAKAVCEACEVKRECLCFGVAFDEAGCVYGGVYLSERQIIKERRRMRREGGLAA